MAIEVIQNVIYAISRCFVLVIVLVVAFSGVFCVRAAAVFAAVVTGVAWQVLPPMLRNSPTFFVHNSCNAGLMT